MRRFVAKCEAQTFDQWCVSGKVNKSPARGEVMASTMRIAYRIRYVIASTPYPAASAAVVTICHTAAFGALAKPLHQLVGSLMVPKLKISSQSALLAAIT